MEQTDQDAKLASKLEVQKQDYQLPSYKIGQALLQKLQENLSVQNQESDLENPAKPHSAQVSETKVQKQDLINEEETRAPTENSFSLQNFSDIATTVDSGVNYKKDKISRTR